MERKIVLKQDILDALLSVGVSKGQTIMVHTSLSSLGFVCGGAQMVIEALIEAVGNEGTIMMPTQSWKNLDPTTGVHWEEPEDWWQLIRDNWPAYNKEITPTNTMGAVAEMFRKWPGALRSDHPARSVAAWGKYAEYLTAAHDLSNIFGDGSPIGKLYELDGLVLLIGVGYDKNTSLHLADVRADYPGMERIKRRKAQGLQDRYLYDYTFSNDNGQNPLMDKAHAYVENWKEAYKSNIGLLLFGDVGTGKSFFAGCIANALLDQDVPVLMTNFPTILNRLTGMFAEDRSEFIASFDEYDLLIIDDLGVERSTEYAMEQMFFVIDSRYRSRRPMIITTNLKLSELKNPPDLAHARIYDRILERCAPILFDGKNFREENAGATRQTAKDIVNSKHD